MTKVAQSATAMWQEPCQISKEVGLGTFSNNFFFARKVFNFSFQGQKSKLT